MGIDLNPFSVLKRHGLKRTLQIAGEIVAEKMQQQRNAFKHRNAEAYSNPTPAELAFIEEGLCRLGVTVNDIWVKSADFEKFKANLPFPFNYHGGIKSGVWEEKLFEHFLAFDLLSLQDYGARDVYVDVAAGCSPWATMLRQKYGFQAFAVDLNISKEFERYDYYKKENAIRTSLDAGSVRGASLQCAYEMFVGTDDIELLRELKRILQPGGKTIIAPLYMHTHYCCYASTEYFGKGWGDREAKEYIRRDCSCIPSSRKYDALKFQERIIDRLVSLGMTYKLYALRNAREISPEIYCHFILEISK